MAYALFKGRYGKFTIPVLVAKEIAPPSPPESRTLSVPTSYYNQFVWIESETIYNLVPEPQTIHPNNYTPENVFSTVSEPQLKICAVNRIGVGTASRPAIDVWRGDSVAAWNNTEGYNQPPVLMLLNLPDYDENKYFPVFSRPDSSDVDSEGNPIAFKVTIPFNIVDKYVTNLSLVGSPVVPFKILFYLASPEQPINVKRGQPIELAFNMQYSDGSIIKNVPFTYDKSQPDASGITNWVIEGNTLTFTNECYYAIAWIRFHPVNYPDIEYVLEVHIIDPVIQPNLPGPYLPEGGGISGGGNGSTGSNTVTGTFDAQPGPSIVENLPVGSSGSDIASSGMYTKYLCNNALLDLLAGFFWEDNIGIQALKAVFGNPIDSIISLACYPFALETLAPNTSTTIYFGKYNTTWPAFSLTKSSFQIDWGTVSIPFFWGSFLDYAPYTKIQLYLPWGVGFVSLDPNEVMPWSSKNSFNQTDFATGSVRVITNIELDKGSCVHNVVGNGGRIIGSFGGVVGKQIPVVGTDDSARTLAFIGAAMMIGTTAAGAAASYGGATAGAATAGGFLGAFSGVAQQTGASIPSSTVLSSMTAIARETPTYPRAGTFSDATNTLGYQYPYLIISRPSQSVPQQYGRFMGYPSNIFHAHLGEVRGYTEVSSIHLDNITATANELDELESILKGGVLL